MHAPPLINVKELTFQNPIVYFFADPSQKVSRPPFSNAVTLLPFDDFCRVPNVKAVMKIPWMFCSASYGLNKSMIPFYFWMNLPQKGAILTGLIIFSSCKKQKRVPVFWYESPSDDRPLKNRGVHNVIKKVKRRFQPFKINVWHAGRRCAVFTSALQHF